MPISHELSGEIATALFAGTERSPRDLSELREIVLKVHFILEKLTRDDRVARMDSFTRHTLIRRAAKDS